MISMIYAWLRPEQYPSDVDIQTVDQSLQGNEVTHTGLRSVCVRLILSVWTAARWKKLCDPESFCASTSDPFHTHTHTHTRTETVPIRTHANHRRQSLKIIMITLPVRAKKLEGGRQILINLLKCLSPPVVDHLISLNSSLITKMTYLSIFVLKTMS